MVNPDGSAPRRLTPGATLGLAWSPDHHELVFRYGAQGDTPTPPAGATWAAAESPSELGVVSISGGQPTQITPSGRGLVRSDAWWDTQGNRLLYREYAPGAGVTAPVYIDSQNDQPIGIARKVILGAASLPTLAPDGSRVAVIDPSGAALVGAPGQTGPAVARGALPQAPGGLPARLLWQPGKNALLSPSAGSNGAVSLALLDLSAHTTRALTSVSGLRDVAFSPDGSLLLLATPSGYLIWPLVGNAPRAVIAEPDPLAQAFWSPDGRWLLVEDAAGARLISAVDWQVRASLTYAQPLTEPQVGGQTLWRPAASSPWRPDSAAFAFAAGAGAQWNGKPLPAPHGQAGLYIATVAASGAQVTPSLPTLIASGPLSAPGWSAPDPSTTLLQAAAG